MALLLLLLLLLLLWWLLPHWRLVVLILVVRWLLIVVVVRLLRLLRLLLQHHLGLLNGVSLILDVYVAAALVLHRLELHLLLAAAEEGLLLLLLLHATGLVELGHYRYLLLLLNVVLMIAWAPLARI